MLKHIEYLAFIVPCIIILMFIVRAKGSRRSKLFGLFMGVAALVFLGGGLCGTVTHQWQHVQAEAVLGILAILFGCTCLMATHIHFEIARLRDELASKSDKEKPARDPKQLEN